MAATKRKFIAVTLKPDLHERVKAIAEARDIPITALIRELIEAELKRLSSTDWDVNGRKPRIW